MFDEILYQIRTKEEKETLLREIEILIESLYQDKGEAFASILKTKVRDRYYSLLKSVFSDEAVDKKDYLEKLKNELEKLKEVEITLAFEPTYDFLDRLSFFIKNSIASNVIMSINYDPNILGGALLIYKGNWRDFSFRKVFQEEFERDRGEILKMLTKSDAKL